MSKILEIKNLSVSYGGIEAIKNISLDVEAGSIVTLIGSNGAGKSSTLRSIAGIVKAKSGEVLFEGENILGLSPDQIVKRGVTLVPEGRRVFPNLTVAENLHVGAYLRKDDIKPDLEYVYELFPRLKERSWQFAGTLSGGEQQMLAVGRAMMARPKLIMMDEPFAALDYFTREQMQKELLRVQQERSASILFVTHSIDEALILGSQIAVIEKGMVKALYEVKAPQEERNLLEDEMITLKRDIINNLHFIYSLVSISIYLQHHHVKVE